jgi:1,4-alpha-glucan branching enzyme
LVLNAPGAQAVAVTGDFCDWAADGRPLRRGDNGTWTTTLLLPPGRYEYRFLVDGQWADDPGCPDRVPNPFGTENCVLQVEPARSVESRKSQAA